MKIKKSLENRVRGWFPKEPNFDKPIQQFVPVSPTNQEMTSPGTNTFEQRTMIFVSLPFLFIACFFAFGFFIYDYKIAWQIVVLGFVFGLIAGTLISSHITKIELEQLSQRGKISGLIVKRSITALIFALVSIFFILFFYSGYALGIFLDISLASVVSFRLSNFILCLRWENNSKKRIYTKSSWEIYAIHETSGNVGN